MARIKVIRSKSGSRKVVVETNVIDRQREDVKTLLGGHYNEKMKWFEFPVELIVDLIAMFGEDAIKDDDTLNVYRKMITDERVVDKIKAGEDAFLPTVRNLMKHQRQCLGITKSFDRYAFFLDTGTGKTVAALSIINDNRHIKWLIISPKNIIRTAWLDDATQFFPQLKILPLSKNFTKRFYLNLAKDWGAAPSFRTTVTVLQQGLATMADAIIINPESFKSEMLYLSRIGIDGLIVDESSIIKNQRSDITKCITQFSRNVRKCYILSGKPAPNNMLEYFSQMDIVCPGLLGYSFYAFRGHYFEPFGFKGYQWRPKKGSMDRIARRVARRAFFVSKEDCLDLPPKTYITKEVFLEGKPKKYYEQMEQERVLELKDKTVTAANLLTALMKLRQITSGFVLDNDEATMLHTHKLEALLETLDEIGDKPVIIWCNFQKEIRIIEETLAKLGCTVTTAYGGTKNVDESIEAFKEGRAQYMIAHPATLKYGVTFTHCTYAVYYSLSYSFENYYQSHDRIYRKGQTQPCTFIFLLCPNTIDMVIHQVLQEKGDLAKAVEDYVKHVTERENDDD